MVRNEYTVLANLGWSWLLASSAGFVIASVAPSIPSSLPTAVFAFILR